MALEAAAETVLAVAPAQKRQPQSSHHPMPLHHPAVATVPAAVTQTAGAGYRNAANNATDIAVDSAITLEFNKNIAYAVRDGNIQRLLYGLEPIRFLLT